MGTPRYCELWKFSSEELRLKIKINPDRVYSSIQKSNNNLLISFVSGYEMEITSDSDVMEQIWLQVLSSKSSENQGS
ncbi:MAG TPA: hypothetical protein VK184_14370 [Nostocaceae cyanobacterium]|nr:hypothetical protein [Nostocaceae cyanobacterium]